jgi:hypothetical protein
MNAELYTDADILVEVFIKKMLNKRVRQETRHEYISIELSYLE